ncbi:MAG: ATP-binding protein [Bacteroidales bacterium]
MKKIKLSFNQRIFLYFFILFTAFTLAILAYQQKLEKNYREQALRSNLDQYSELIAKYIQQDKEPLDSLASLEKLLPPNLRFTILNIQGNVLFDNTLKNFKNLENHLNRKEIKIAQKKGKGNDIRVSMTAHKTYYYFARKYPHYYVRVALPYNVEVQRNLYGNHHFLWFVGGLFIVSFLLLIYLSHSFSKAIKSLKNFLEAANHGSIAYHKIKFPHTELGEIGTQIIASYQLIEDKQKQLEQERERLLYHFDSSIEGISIFSETRQKIYANTHFIQYLNLLAEKDIYEVEAILDKELFPELITFLDSSEKDVKRVFEQRVSKNGTHFILKALVSADNSFEISLTNISKIEQNRILKQEMTNNIAHELRTPVSSIRGYIETLLLQKEVSPEMQKFFLERTFVQVERLSTLIRDIALITKTEEAANLFNLENVFVNDVFLEVISDLQTALEANAITILNTLPENCKIEGNKTLVYAIFRNLIENSISYAGKGIELGVECYLEDDNFYYLRYWDTGMGINPKHLVRIFERFYRVNDGRSRENGGSGLGLSIVKNAVLFHGGEINAKITENGGLGFVFSLEKKMKESV